MNKAKIAFLVYMSDRYYNSGTKPFVDIALGLLNRLKDVTPFLLFLNSPSYEDVKKRFPQIPAYEFTNVDEINYFLEKQRIDIVVFDDFRYRLKILEKVKSKRKVVYVQHLTGINVINNLSNKMSLKLKIASYLPWHVIVSQYIKRLEEADVIIGNSYTTTHYLASLFGISSSGVVYPPVGANLIVKGKEVVERKGILVYKGHKPDFQVRDLHKDISELSKIDEVIIWGEGALENIGDEELSKLYSSVKLVYSSTSFELFGYVGAEALLFGTPVLLNVYHPFLEKVPMDTNMVKILGRRKLDRGEIEEFIGSKKDDKRAKEAIISNYSLEASASSLIKILSKELDI